MQRLDLSGRHLGERHNFGVQGGGESKPPRLIPPKAKSVALFSILTVFLYPRILSRNNPPSPSQSGDPPPKIVITKVKLPGIIGQVRTDADLRRVIDHPTSVKLSWKDNFLIVEFEIQGSNDPEKNQYAYRIMGRDEDWIQIGNKNSVVLENLQRGRYTLQVKGASSEGIWDEEGAVLNIQVIPAWHQTLVFKMVSLAIISYVLFVLFKLGRKLYRARLEAEIDITRLASEFLLTPREVETILLVLKGKSIKDISRELYISQSTVQKHVYSVYKKTRVENRLQLIDLARRYSQK